jgi:hypothetical protein
MVNAGDRNPDSPVDRTLQPGIDQRRGAAQDLWQAICLLAHTDQRQCRVVEQAAFAKRRLELFTIRDIIARQIQLGPHRRLPSNSAARRKASIMGTPFPASRKVSPDMRQARRPSRSALSENLESRSCQQAPGRRPLKHQKRQPKKRDKGGDKHRPLLGKEATDASKKADGNRLVDGSSIEDRLDGRHQEQRQEKESREDHHQQKCRIG